MPDEKPEAPLPSGRTYEQSFDATMSPISATLDRQHVSVSEFWEKSWPLLIPYLFITFLSPVLVLWLIGMMGVGVGELLALVNLVLGFYAVTRLRETRRSMHKA